MMISVMNLAATQAETILDVYKVSTYTFALCALLDGTLILRQLPFAWNA